MQDVAASIWLIGTDREWTHQTTHAHVGDARCITTTDADGHPALRLTSTYLGASTAPTRVTHALAADGQPAVTWSRSYSADSMDPARSEPCLLDHLHEVQDALRLLGHTAAITTPIR